ncbi:hypothetical protein KR215_008250 [Drosophila sulfurigaster]|nr:hypothetical protein KR215_008250 [Drosophila sulfurigaster]
MENTVNKRWLFFEVVILLLGVTTAVHYRVEFENEDLFSPCAHLSEKVKDIQEFLDFSELQIKEVDNKLMVSGNMSSNWDYDPTDRLETISTLYRFERREWVNTVISARFNNMCDELFDERKQWYLFWTNHVINIDDVRNTCFLKGSKFIHETFTTDGGMDLQLMVPQGRHKLVVLIKAIDKNYTVRYPILCFEIIGEIIRE